MAIKRSTTNATAIVQRYQQMRSERASIESEWQDVANLCLPSRDFFIDGQMVRQRRYDDIYDPIGMECVEEWASSMLGLMMNPLVYWHAIMPQDPDLMDDDDTVEWCQHSTRVVHQIFNSPSRGFYASAAEVWLDLGAFGQGAVISHDNQIGELRFQSRPPSEIFLAENYCGEVDTVFRPYWMTGRQLLQTFAADAIPDACMKDWNQKPDERFQIIHAIYPRSDRDPRRADNAHKPYASVHVSVAHEELLRESGFDDMPILTPRLMKRSGECYGTGPGVKMRPAVATVNAKVRTQLVAGEKVADPPIVAPAGGVDGPINTAPGSIIWRKPGAPMPEALNSNANVNFTERTIESDRNAIRRGFWLHIIGPLPENDRMTTEEIRARIQQRMTTVVPHVSRAVSEWIGKQVILTHKYAMKNGLIKPPPGAMRGRKLKVEYVSPLALGQRSSESSNMSAFFNFLQPLVAQDPEMATALRMTMDPDMALRHAAFLFNVPRKILRDRQAVMSKIKQQEQQQQAAAMLSQLQAGADAADKGASAIQKIGSVAPQVPVG